MSATFESEIHLPDLGEGLESARVDKWLVGIGDRVARDQSLVEVTTDKAVVELPAPADGTVAEILVAPGTEVAVGTVLARLDLLKGISDQRSPRAAPAVRILAEELGIDLALVRPSRPDGRLTADDLLEHAAPGRVLNGLGHQDPGRYRLPDRWRRAASMLERSARIPQVASSGTVDATALLAHRREMLSNLSGLVPHPIGLFLARSLTPWIISAAGRSLRDVPLMNSHLDANATHLDILEHCSISVVVNTTDGLRAPVIHEADRRGVVDIAEELYDLVTAARGGRLPARAERGASFTVSDTGGIGGAGAPPLIRPPEVGGLGVGAPQERVVALDGLVQIRPTISLSVAGDHRVVSAVNLVSLQRAVTRQLETPGSLPS